MLQDRHRNIWAKKYEEIKLLGEGSYGKAYLVESNEDKSLAVIKTIDLGNSDSSSKDQEFLEGQILEKLNHPNIIRFRDIIKESKPGNKNILHIIMDYADGGDLNQKIRAQKGKLFSENQILDWFTQICLAIKHIHDRKILHRDIKSQNIFLTKNGLVKLGDFGIAKCLNNTIAKAKTMVGTPYYLSPEIINGQLYNFKSDIWSLGVLLYEMCTLKVPFDSDNMVQLSMKIVNCNYQPISNIFSKEIRSLVHEMLNVNYRKRPAIKDILKKPIIQSRIKNFLNEVDYNAEFSHTILHKFDVLKSKKNIRDDIVNESNKFPNKNYQRPIIVKEEKQLITSSNNKNKNYHYRDKEDNREREREKYKETIQISKDQEYDRINHLKRNLEGKAIPNFQERKHSGANVNGNYHHKHQLERDGYTSNGSNDKRKNNSSSNKKAIRKDTSERILRKGTSSDKEHSSIQTDNQREGSEIGERKKTERSDSKGSKNELKEFMKNKKEQIKNIQENNVKWVKDMKDFLQNLDIQKKEEINNLKSNESEIKKNVKELNEFIDSQKMLLEYEKLQDMGEETANVNDDIYNGEENHIANYNLNKLITSQSEKSRKTIDNQIKLDIDNEIGKELVCSFVGIIKKYIHDDIIFFDYDEIVNKIKKELENKNIGASIIEKAIEKIPDIYYLMLNNRL